jgi:hypothetical protein
VNASTGIGGVQLALCAAALVGGLWLDVRTDIVGQTAIGLACWGLLLYLLACAAWEQRRMMLACVVIATAGELFASLVWGLYTYRLGNVPQFVPPGHVMLFLLGLALARRMPEPAANAILGAAGLYALIAAFAGMDTFAVPLFVLLALASLALPAQRRLYASTCMLSLALELYGTALGNWTWIRGVPGTALVTTNPPLEAGAFYSTLDALVAVAGALLAPRLAARAGPVNPPGLPTR